MEIARSHDDSFDENVVVVVTTPTGWAHSVEPAVAPRKCPGLVPQTSSSAPWARRSSQRGLRRRQSESLRLPAGEGADVHLFQPDHRREAAAAAAVSVVESEEGRSLLGHLAAMTARFESGLVARGLRQSRDPTRWCL